MRYTDSDHNSCLAIILCFNHNIQWRCLFFLQMRDTNHAESFCLVLIVCHQHFVLSMLFPSCYCTIQTMQRVFVSRCPCVIFALEGRRAELGELITFRISTIRFMRMAREGERHYLLPAAARLGFGSTFSSWDDSASSSLLARSSSSSSP